MKSLTFLGRLSKPKYWLILRRVRGTSMVPTLLPGRLVMASAWYWRLKPGDMVIVQHDGIEKIKRAAKLSGDRLYLTGDNRLSSTDSRHFGWLDRRNIIAKVFMRPGKKSHRHIAT